MSTNPGYCQLRLLDLENNHIGDDGACSLAQSPRLSIIAFITDLLVVRKILAHLRLPTTLSPPSPTRLDVQLDLDFDFDQDPATDHSVPSCRDPPDSIALY